MISRISCRIQYFSRYSTAVAVAAVAVDPKTEGALAYFQSCGISENEASKVLSRYPNLSNEAKIKPVVEYLLNLGLDASSLSQVMLRGPQVFSSNVGTLDSARAHLEGLGVKKESWQKILPLFPYILAYRKQKIDSIFEFFSEIGVTQESVVGILTKYPQITRNSVENRLRPTVAYLMGLGIPDLTMALQRWPRIMSYSVDSKLGPTAAYLISHGIEVRPQLFNCSLETKLKPGMEYLVEKGLTSEEIRKMMVRYPLILCLSLRGNLEPKWDFSMNQTKHTKEELVNFPQYFSYSMEKRIKPRYAIVEKYELNWNWNKTLSFGENKFREMLLKATNGRCIESFIEHTN